VSFVGITLCVASQRVFVVVYFVIDSVRKLLDTPSYMLTLSFHLTLSLPSDRFVKISPPKFGMLFFPPPHPSHMSSLY
jgi:hypothetical protein